jgi:hypothetical protein
MTKKISMRKYFHKRIVELEKEYQERMDNGETYFAARAMERIVELGQALCSVKTCEKCEKNV